MGQGLCQDRLTQEARPKRAAYKKQAFASVTIHTKAKQTRPITAKVSENQATGVDKGHRPCSTLDCF